MPPLLIALMAAMATPWAAGQGMDVFGIGPESRKRRHETGSQMLANALLLQDERQSRQRTSKERTRTQRLESMHRSADRESMMTMMAHQLAMGQMGQSEDMGQALRSAAMMSGMGGGGGAPQQQTLQPTGNPLLDYGLI